MKKKHRDIVVDDQTYGWQVRGSFIIIWKDKKIILETETHRHTHPITPKTIEDVIRKEVLKQGKYVLLRGREHKNVFWTSYNKESDYDAEGYDMLYIGMENDEMVAEWEKHNPLWQGFTNILDYM